jgi:hypothetical protein
MEPEGSNEIERWGRPRTDGGDGTSSGVVFADAPWVLVVFSEASGLPSWDDVRRGGEKPNTKWRTWVRLKYAGDEMKAASDAVLVGMYGHPSGWPSAAVKVLQSDADIVRAWLDSRD